MVTKDQLERLRQERSAPDLTLDYTPGGTLETASHMQVNAERQRMLAHGQSALEHAGQTFQDDMRGAFERGPNHLPEIDRTLAEATWRDTHIATHEDKLSAVSEKLNRHLEQATANRVMPVDTDLGYGAGHAHPLETEHLSSHSSERIKAFAQSVGTARDQPLERER